jgi:predicted acetyltransferase
VAVPARLGLWLTDGRQVRTESLRDFLWLRPIDTCGLLAARTYGASGSLVIDVVDPFLDLEETVGRFRVEGGPDGASCTRTQDPPDLALDAAALGAITLGGTRPSRLARGGLVTAVDPARLALADLMFGAEREPYGATWF